MGFRLLGEVALIGFDEFLEFQDFCLQAEQETHLARDAQPSFNGPLSSEINATMDILSID